MNAKKDIDIDKDLEKLDIILKELENLEQIDELKDIDLDKLDIELEEKLKDVSLEDKEHPFYYLKKAYDLLMQKAEKITDEKMRKSFLENQINKEIIEEVNRIKDTNEWKMLIK